MTVNELIKLCRPFAYTKYKNGEPCQQVRGNETIITFFMDYEVKGKIRNGSFSFNPSCIMSGFFNEELLELSVKHITCKNNGVMEVYLGRID